MTINIVLFLGPGQQPSTVAVSGFTVNTNVMFTAYSSVSKFLPEFTIKNDDVALETVETYNIILMSSDPSHDVLLGSDSTIMITDEDGTFKLEIFAWYHALFLIVHK